MAAAEAKALLDQLMGGDRNAPLPPGAALPSHNKKKRKASDGSLLLPGKRHKSCYDRDICPLYCAWGVDVYDLFVNTKSDIGPNPNKPDEDARKEYLTLPQHEKERLGFEHLLFHKLGELVQQCDRAVTRNQEKLNKELQRQLQKRGGQDYVIDVDEGAVEQLCRNQLLVEDLTTRLAESLVKIKEIKLKEDDLSRQIVNQNKERQNKKEAKSGKKEENGDADIKKEDDEETKVKEEAEGEDSAKPANGDVAVKKEDGDEVPVKKEDEQEDESAEKKDDETAPAVPEPPSAAALELGKIILEKQRLLVDIASILGQLGPCQEAVENQSRQLNHVKSDITTDKTVCDVSGNFMSARDADERIAAHYAGKQYVGWKLVREKFKELLGKHGKYGPPPPGRGNNGPPGQQMMMAPPGGRGGGARGGGGDRRGSGGRDFGGGGRYGGGPPRGGGGGRDSSPGRWERHGGGGYGDRGGDRYGGGSRGGGDRGRRGSYDDRRGGGGGDRYGDRRGGGGGYGGRR